MSFYIFYHNILNYTFGIIKFNTQVDKNIYNKKIIELNIPITK